MILAQVAESANADEAIQTATELIGTWEPIIVMVLVPVLTSFFTKEAAEKYVKQAVAIIATAIAVGLTIASDGGLDAFDPSIILLRFATYSALAERAYRGFSAVAPARNLNGVGVLRPNWGIGKPKQQAYDYPGEAVA